MKTHKTRALLFIMAVFIASVDAYGQDQSKKELRDQKRAERAKARESRAPDYSTYTNIYEAITDAVPEAQRVFLDNRRSVFVLRGITSISGRNYARFAVNGLLVDNIDHIVLDRVTRIYKMPKTQLATFGSQAAGGIICISTE